MSSTSNTPPNTPNASTPETPVKSPCISICALDSEGVCTGCFRSGEEIRRWGSYSNDERRGVLTLAHNREKKVNPFL